MNKEKRIYILIMLFFLIVLKNITFNDSLMHLFVIKYNKYLTFNQIFFIKLSKTLQFNKILIDKISIYVCALIKLI